MQIQRNFDEAMALPNVKINNRDGTPNAEGRGMFERLLRERMATELIAPAAMERLIEVSGGIPVTLIDLTQRAVLQPLTRKSETVEVDDVEPAIDKERADYQAVLTPEHLALLKARIADKVLINDGPNRECLHNLSLVEYANANTWRDVHPVVKSLLAEAV